MGHKGISKRKLPKEKSKPPAIANHGSGPVSGLVQSEGVGGQLPEKAKAMPFGQGEMNPSSGSKKGHKNH
jgi:hypothetical protein